MSRLTETTAKLNHPPVWMTSITTQHAPLFYTSNYAPLF